MRNLPKIAIAVATTLTVVGATASADAAGKAQQTTSRIVMTETLNFNQNPTLTSFRSSVPGCPRGTFADTVVDAQGGDDDTPLKLKIDTVYTCSNGSGKIFAHKSITLFGVNDFSSNYSTGRIRITGGTKAYKGISGQGSITGGNVDGFANGVIQGHVRLPR
jgi:hypothetical protein